jgi:hypothetical protein
MIYATAVRVFCTTKEDGLAMQIYRLQLMFTHILVTQEK